MVVFVVEQGRIIREGARTFFLKGEAKPQLSVARFSTIKTTDPCVIASRQTKLSICDQSTSRKLHFVSHTNKCTINVIWT